MAFTQITNISYLVMKQQGCGKFVAISSIGGIRGAENDSGYSASKSYIIKYIEGMARKSNKEGKHVSFQRYYLALWILKWPKEIIFSGCALLK